MDGLVGRISGELVEGKLIRTYCLKKYFNKKQETVSLGGSIT